MYLTRMPQQVHPQYSQTYGLIFALSCAQPGVEPDDPWGSLPTVVKPRKRLPRETAEILFLEIVKTWLHTVLGISVQLSLLGSHYMTCRSPFQAVFSVSLWFQNCVAVSKLLACIPVLSPKLSTRIARESPGWPGWKPCPWLWLKFHREGDQAPGLWNGLSE